MTGPYVLKKSDLLINVAKDSPRAAEMLTEYGLHCLTCFLREYETLEIGAKVHGMSDTELDDMISDINARLEKEWKEQTGKNTKHKMINSK